MDSPVLANQLCVDTGCNFKDQWMIGTDGETESGNSVLLTCLDNDDNDNNYSLLSFSILVLLEK